MKLRFLTYNIASGRCFDVKRSEDGKLRTPYDISRCISVIKEINPDFLGLNEICENDKRHDYVSQPKVIADACGFPNYYFGKAISFPFTNEGAGYGNAQASKFPYTSVSTIPIPDPEVKDEEGYYETRAIIKNVIELPDGRKLTVMQVHVGLNLREHQNAVVKLCEEIDSSEYPVILMGDFNMREWDFNLDRIRERLVDVNVAAGKHFPTFPSTKEVYCPDCKIDYIFVSPSIKVLDVGTVQDTASDHLPLYADLEI